MAKQVEKLKARRRYLRGRITQLGPVLRGSVVTLGIRCGNPNCKCAKGKTHPSVYFAVKIKGKSHLYYLGRKFQDKAKAWNRNYQRLKDIFDELTLINIDILKGKRAYKTLAGFSYRKLRKKISRVCIEIKLKNSDVFPKERSRLLSWYEYRERRIHFYPDGGIKGGPLRLLTSLVDFSFIRSLVAHCYDVEGGQCYDPVSIFLLDLFRWFLGHRHMTDFLEDVRDKTKGAQIRLFAGLTEEHIPCPGTFSHFRLDIGEELYDRIFHILVTIVEEIGLITGRFLSTDGTLFPTFARYKGCPYANEGCRCIEVKDVLGKIRGKVREAIRHLNKTSLPKEIKITIPCPNPEATKEKRRRVEVVSFILDRANPRIAPKKDQTPQLLGLCDLLYEHKLVIKNYSSNINTLTLDLRGNPVGVSCPKVPVDIEARLGWRRSKKNP